MPALISSNLPDLPPPKKGKVRDVYDLGDALLIVSTDRISAFDVVMANGIPDKGRVLNQMSSFWFEKFSSLCPNHVISTSDDEIAKRVPGWKNDLFGRGTLARICEPLQIECVARGYISGSLFKEYRHEGPNVHGLGLPQGLLESQKLPEPIFTPATKAQEGHDENLSLRQAADIVGKKLLERLRALTLSIYSKAAEHSASKGIILADTKFEFGLANGQLVWIDEALTPDSSRFWPADQYERGRPQQSYDKQFVRDYLESLGWDKKPPGPKLPEQVVARTREKYLKAFHALTGRKLVGSDNAAPAVR